MLLTSLLVGARLLVFQLEVLFWNLFTVRHHLPIQLSKL